MGRNEITLITQIQFSILFSLKMLVLTLFCILAFGSSSIAQIQPRQSTPQQIALSSGQTYTFKSQNFLVLAYPANSDSSYIFTSPPGTTISISCPDNDFKLKCPNDYLAASPSGDVSTASTDISTSTCKSSTSTFTPVTSTGNKLGVKFHAGSRSFFDLFFYRYQCTLQASVAPPTTNSTCNCGVRHPSSTTSATRIVGGVEAQPNEFPWRVLLDIKLSLLGPNAVCGGSIISPSWIMTAAHCVKDLTLGYQITAIVGAHKSTNDGQRITVDRYETFPGYNSQTYDGDMSLLHLSKPLTFTDSVAPLCLPWNMQNATFDNITVVASGWGTTKPVPVGQANTDSNSNVLMEVDLPVFGTKLCKKMFPNITYITDNMICTYLPGKDTCQGDSGGSIDYQNSTNGTSYYGVGVVSFGEGCASNDKPGLYSKVTKFLSWIQTTTAGDQFCSPASA